MNKKRLLKLADLLEENAANRKGLKFDLDVIGETKMDEYGVPIAVPMDCNTVGCAMGLAAISGVFKRAGLEYGIYAGIDGQGKDIWEVAVMMDDGDREYTDIDAAVPLFGINTEAAYWLFSGSGAYNRYGANRMTGARAERMVAKRIRDFVAGKASPPPQD